jgi:RNA polymerase sigma-70 factor (ECF subfamily)
MEKELLARIAEGDGDAFYDFYQEYAPRLRSYVLKSTRSEADTEEILQASFIRIWLSRDKMMEVENIAAWVYTITARICLQHFRKQKREKQKLAHLEQVAEPVPAVDTPFDLVRLDEIRTAIHTVVQRMPDTRRTIYRLSREKGKKPAEIALLLQMPVGTVKNQLSAAMKEIREFLVASGYEGFLLIFVFLTHF